MPIIKSAQKALRQSKKRRALNIQKNKKLKNLLKEVKRLVSEKNFDEVKKLLSEIYKALDKAAKTGLIKENTAARKKSKIAKLISGNKQV